MEVSRQDPSAPQNLVRPRASLPRWTQAPIPSVALGIVVALTLWWAVDLVSTEIERRVNLAMSSEGLVIVLFATALIATAILLLSAKAMLSAGVVLLFGIAFGLLANRGIRIVGVEGAMLFALLRGSHNPAILALAAAWSTMALRNLKGARPNEV